MMTLRAGRVILVNNIQEGTDTGRMRQRVVPVNQLHNHFVHFVEGSCHGNLVRDLHQDGGAPEFLRLHCEESAESEKASGRRGAALEERFRRLSVDTFCG